MSNENGNITPEINENQIFAQRVAKLDDIAADHTGATSNDDHPLSPEVCKLSARPGPP